jgi:two-component system, cell cycle sensor histidine kinase and response regulator CckA
MRPNACRSPFLTRVILVSVACGLLACAAWAEAAREKVRVGIYDMDPLCHCWTGKDEKQGGLFIELLAHVASQERWDITYVCGTLDECLQKLAAAEIDLLAAVPFSESRASEYDFTRETVISTWGQVYGPEGNGIGSVLDLSGRMVGVVRDDPYNQELRDTLRRFNIPCRFVEFKHSGEVFQAIKKGWVGAGVVDRLFGMQHQGDYGVRRTPVIFSPVELRFAVPKDRHQKLIDALDYHLNELKANPDSLYYTLVNRVFGVSGIHSIPRWLVWGIVILLVLSLLAGGTGLVFRRQVRIKTAQLSKKTDELDAEIEIRKKAQEGLAQSEARYRSLVENNLYGYFIFAYPSGKVLFFNQRMVDLFGYPQEETRDKTLWDLVAPSDHQTVRERIQSRVNGRPPDEVPYICTAVRKDGSAFDAETSASVLEFEGKKVIQGTLRDVTEQERLKQHLQHAQKMEAIGTLAGGVAHDFNNLLMGIMGNASLMKMDLEAGHPHWEKLTHIEEYAESGSTLTRQLLGLARGGKYEPKALHLNDVVEKTSRMFGRTRKEIAIHASYEKDLWTVQADGGQMEQILLNMYVNAWQAMPEGGDLYLRTENVTIGEDHVRARQGKEGNYVRISVTDTGVGMDEKTRNRIFEPFFTTKGMGRGTGLGLASAYGIIKNHGGFIDVYSEKGKGATFCIYLPATSKAALSLSSDGSANRDIQKGEGTVLVVDDEEMIVEVGASLLEKIGYQVLVAKSGEEALEIYRNNDELIDIVLLDMIMPGMGGKETFEKLKQIDPSVKVLLSSGYSINAQTTDLLKCGCRGFIQKPFSMAALSKKLREVSCAS